MIAARRAKDAAATAAMIAAMIAARAKDAATAISTANATADRIYLRHCSDCNRVTNTLPHLCHSSPWR
jgi:hypothetical protein